VQPEWLDGSGVSVKDVRTPYGPVSYTLRREGRKLVLHVPDSVRVPPGGLVLVWPDGAPPSRDTRVNGQTAPWQGSELRLHSLPATVVVEPE